MSAKAFGGVFATLTMGFIGGNQLNVFLLRRYNSRQIFGSALGLQVLTGLIFVAAAQVGWLGIAGNLILFFVFLSCIGLTYPNAAAIALGPFSRIWPGRLSRPVLECLDHGRLSCCFLGPP